MKRVVLERFSDDGKQTLGELVVLKDGKKIFECKTLELPWRNNKVQESCIPPGEYKAVPYSSSKYPNVYEITNVPGRSKILFHWGNYRSHTLGCILLGEAHVDINRDKLADVVNSREAVDGFRSAIGKESFMVTILKPGS